MQQLSDILDLSKIEAGTLGYEYSDVELNAVMEELEGGFRMRQPENSPVRITFHRKYPVRYIRTDRKRLIQVIANLLSNAVKFTSEGSVDFGFEIRGGELYVYVADTGAGVFAEERGDSYFNVSSRRDRSGRASASSWRSRSRSSKRWAAASASNPDRAKARPSGSRSPASRSNKHRYPLRGFQTFPSRRSEGFNSASSTSRSLRSSQASQRVTERKARRAAGNSGSAGSLTTGSFLLPATISPGRSAPPALWNRRQKPHTTPTDRATSRHTGCRTPQRHAVHMTVLLHTSLIQTVPVGFRLTHTPFGHRSHPFPFKIPLESLCW